MRNHSKINAITTFATCAGIVFLSSCAKQGATEKDKAQATPPPAASSNTVAAVETPPPAQAPAENQQPEAASGGQRYVLVATIDGLDANNEFQRNVDLMQSQRQLAINLNEQIGLATNDETRAALQEQYDQALAKLNENNQKMLQGYSYSLNRNYLRVIDKSQVYMAVNAEEAAQFEANRQQQEESTPSE